MKDFSEFHRYKNSPDGFKARCKGCRNADNKAHRESNPGYYQKWRDDNKAGVKEYNTKYNKENRVAITAQKRLWVEENKDSVKAYKKQWFWDNRDRIQEDKNKRYKEDLEFRIAYKLRNRMYAAVKRNSKNGSAVSDLGCSIKEFKIYIENMFESGMTWDNYTLDGWHIDHIIPLCSFDLTDREQVKKACHYTNLQPLWAEDNLAKGSRTS